MSTFSTVEEAREYFKNDRFATENGMRLDELTEDGCVCSVVLGERHRNALGGVMGGVLFTLADFAFAIASNTAHHGTVAIDVNIHFLAAPKGSKLTARASCVKDGRTTAVYEAKVTDDTGRDVALFLGTGYKLQK